MSTSNVPLTRHQYANDNILQTYDVYIPAQPRETTQHADPQIWLIYIHGGYFRDPKVDSTSFRPTIANLEGIPLTTPSTDHTPPSPRIAGYATINYRLSPHPAYPPPKHSPAYESRTARFPDQLSDILAALTHLHSSFPSLAQHGYLLAGHSVGATLALLATLRCRAHGVPAPRAVVGLSGIYDFPAIHESNPEYVEMTRNAVPEERWGEASPARWGVAEYVEAMGGGARVVLAHSRDDGLVEWGQVQRMEGVLREGEGGEVDLRVVELWGKHNDIYEDGRESARAVRAGLEMLR